MPLTRTGCQHRRESLLSQVSADVIVISNPRHVQYFCGYWVTPLHIGGWGAPHLLIEVSSGKATLLTHDFAPDTYTAHVDDVQIWHWYDAVNAPGSPLFPQMVLELAPQLHGRVAYEAGCLPHGALMNATDSMDITTTILAMRRTKYDDELVMLRNCVRAVSAGHRAVRENIAPGLTEIDVYNAFYGAVWAEVGKPVVPLGDFASGERAFQGGGAPTKRIIEPDDVMIVDAFPIIDGYRADFTATYAVTAPLTDAQGKLETALHAALHAGESLLKPGTPAQNIYNVVKSTLDEHGYADSFPHHAGHGLGLGHPEVPFFVADSTDILQRGDVVTLEPGAYGADFGGRIEHNYLITDKGFERLTNHDTHFLSVE